MDALTHETAVKMPTPAGTVSAVHVPPPFAVPIATGPPKMPNPTAVQSELVAHEIPFSPLTWVGMTSGFHAYPAFNETWTELIPTAKQLALLGHEIAFNPLAPGGGFWTTHDTPPVVVPIMVDPAPVLPLLPTAMQSTAVAHEMPVRSMAFDGVAWDDQVEPLFEVPITYAAELRFVPTAIHVVSIGQAIEFSCVPVGMRVGAVQVDKSTVRRDVPPPPSAIPEATQFVALAQEMEVSDDTAG